MSAYGWAMMMTIATTCCLALLFFSISAEGTLRVQAYLPRLLPQHGLSDVSQAGLDSVCLDTRKSWGTSGHMPAVDLTEGDLLEPAVSNSMPQGNPAHWHNTVMVVDVPCTVKAAAGVYPRQGAQGKTVQAAGLGDPSGEQVMQAHSARCMRTLLRF